MSRRPDDGAAAPRPGAAAAAFRRLGTAGPPAGRAQGAGGGVVAQVAWVKRGKQVEKKAHLGYLG